MTGHGTGWRVRLLSVLVVSAVAACSSAPPLVAATQPSATTTPASLTAPPAPATQAPPAATEAPANGTQVPLATADEPAAASPGPAAAASALAIGTQAPIAATLASAGSRATTGAAEAPCLAGLAAGAGSFLATDGRRFTCRSRPVPLSGFTMYPGIIGGAAAWHTTTFRSYIDAMLDLGARAGLNLVRPTDEWDSRTANQDWADPVVWQNLDYLVQAARARHMFVVMDLSAMRWVLVSQGRDPFDPEAWRPFIAFATARYAKEPGIAFYYIVGEPTAPRSPSDLDRLTTFYRSTLAMVHAGDPNHLVTLGAFNHMEDETPALPWWQTLYALPGNDIVGFKTYSRHDLDLMPAIAAYARSIHKPLFDGEFGMPQGSGDGAAMPGVIYNGLATGRASFFADVYQAGAAGGVAAYVFWNLGCRLGASRYEVSPATPAVWSVITSHAPLAPALGSPGTC